MVQFCTPVDCRCAVPFFSRTNALIYIDAYLTVSASKVAIITSLDKPNEVILYDRKADPTLVVVAKIVSYIVLAPFALLALFAKWAFRTCSPLYLRPTELLAPLNQPVKDEVLNQGKGGEIIPQLSEKQSQGSPEHETETRVLTPGEEVATVQIETTLQDATDFLTKVELREKGYAQEIAQLMEQFQLLTQLIEICGPEVLENGLQSRVEISNRDVNDLHGQSEKFFSLFRDWRQLSPEQQRCKFISSFSNREELDEIITFFDGLEVKLKVIKETYEIQNEEYKLQKTFFERQKTIDTLKAELQAKQSVEKEVGTVEPADKREQDGVLSQDEGSEINPQLPEKQSQVPLGHESQTRTLQPGEEVAAAQIKKTLLSKIDFLTKIGLREKAYIQEVVPLMEQLQSLKQKIAKSVTICDTETLENGLQSRVEINIQDLNNLYAEFEKFFSLFLQLKQLCLQKQWRKFISLFDSHREKLDESIVVFDGLEVALKTIKEIYEFQKETYEKLQQINALKAEMQTV